MNPAALVARILQPLARSLEEAGRHLDLLPAEVDGAGEDEPGRAPTDSPLTLRFAPPGQPSFPTQGAAARPAPRPSPPPRGRLLGRDTASPPPPDILPARLDQSSFRGASRLGNVRDTGVLCEQEISPAAKLLRREQPHALATPQSGPPSPVAHADETAEAALRDVDARSPIFRRPSTRGLRVAPLAAAGISTPTERFAPPATPTYRPAPARRNASRAPLSAIRPPDEQPGRAEAPFPDIPVTPAAPLPPAPPPRSDSGQRWRAAPSPTSPLSPAAAPDLPAAAPGEVRAPTVLPRNPVLMRVTRAMEPVFDKAWALTDATLGSTSAAPDSPASSLPGAQPPGDEAGTTDVPRVNNHFHVNVALSNDAAGSSREDPQRLEDALVALLRDAARRQGLDV